MTQSVASKAATPIQGVQNLTAETGKCGIVGLLDHGCEANAMLNLGDAAENRLILFNLTNPDAAPAQFDKGDALT
jgi:hypothetical protein